MHIPLQGTITAADLMASDPLFVFALESEAADVFDDVDKLVVGIGKLNAAFHLTKAIRTRRPRMVVNLGSAGSGTFPRGSLVSCERFIQRDMDVRGLGFRRYETPLSGLDPVLSYGLRLEGLDSGICGTGDSFEMAHDSTEYNVIDMEAYALAFVCYREQIPFVCVKFISDGADGGAADDWTVQVHRTALTFKRLLQG
jgi:adenosylhomocysteine nucleosidase